jgi:hypothetical protein
MTRNLAHSCIRRTADEFFADKPAGGVAHAKAFIAEARKLGPVTLYAVKTRIALIGRDYIYHFEISDRRPIDDELRRFLSMSYAIGRREHIVPRESKKPTVKRARRRPAG